MKKIYSIAIALGLIGAIGFADTLEVSTASFLLLEGLSLALAAFGVWGYNKKAEAEAPAHTMKNSQTENS